MLYRTFNEVIKNELGFTSADADELINIVNDLCICEVCKKGSCSISKICALAEKIANVNYSH